MKKYLKSSNGSIDFVQIVIGLLIIAIACVGTFQAINYGNDQLNYQMRYRKAISIARSTVEYWQGRVHTDIDFTNANELAGNLGKVVPSTYLDEYTNCYVRYGKIIPVDLQNTGPGIDHWIIRVQVTWWEPDQLPSTLPHEVTFQGTMVPAEM